jgi:hypothetical protein
VSPSIVSGRVHRDCGIAQHRLGPRGGDHDLARAVGERIGELVELGLRALLVLHLEIGERGAVLDAPVDEPLGPVQEPFLVEADERLADGARGVLVHGEALALPVERRAQRAVLLRDTAAVLLLPLPDAAHELRAAEVVARLPLGAQQLALDHHLRGDARVVDAGLPESVEPAHALPADERVLDGGGEGMSKVQAAGHVRRRQNDAVRRLVGDVLRVEVPTLLPLARPARLDLGRLVGLVQLGPHRDPGLRRRHVNGLLHARRSRRVEIPHAVVDGSAARHTPPPSLRAALLHQPLELFADDRLGELGHDFPGDFLDHLA